MSASGGSRAVLAALAANLGIALIKFIAFLLTGSASMLAESVHSLADSGNQGLLLLGGKRSRRQATPEHPFGFGRDRYVYGFLVALVLFSVGGLFALYEGIHKIADPHHLDSPLIAIVVLVVAIGLESWSFRTAIAESRKLKGDANWVQFIRRAKVPELPVVLLEDFAALIGLALALLGVGLSTVLHQPVWDGIGTAAIGVLLISVAIVLIVETKSLLLGEAASPAAIDRIRQALVGPGVLRVIHQRTLHLGPDEVLLAAKLAMPPNSTLVGVAAAIDAAEARVRAAEPSARVIYLEPDLDRGAEAGRVTLPRVIELDNQIRDYAWGSPTAIPQLLGIEPDGRPAAELWVGAHPDSPSRWAAGPGTPGLDALIAAQPEQLLGEPTVARFGPRLPFLLKLLAADRALSLQAHPTLDQARAGHAAEQAAGARRNYTDPNHKPELAYAISDFQAFCGFRPVPETLRLLDALAVAGWAPYRQLLAGPDGLRAAFTALLALAGADRDGLLTETLAGCRRLTDDPDWSAVAGAVLLAATDHPGDFGPVLALLLNYVRLAPGEAIFLAAGNLHAYLRGTCVEVLASSDNVLRGGLTPKHIDVAELVRIADFNPLAEPRWQPDRSVDGLVRFRVPVPDFELAVLALSEHPQPLVGAGPYLVLAGEQPVTVRAGTALTVRPWHAVFLAATGPDDPPATLTGTGRAFAVCCDSG